MDFLFDLITLPFDLISGSIECLFGCVFLLALTCCILTVVWMFVLN